MERPDVFRMNPELQLRGMLSWLYIICMCVLFADAFCAYVVSGFYELINHRHCTPVFCPVQIPLEGNLYLAKITVLLPGQKTVPKMPQSHQCDNTLSLPFL